MEERLVFSVTFSLHKTLVTSTLQKLNGETNIKEKPGFSLGFDFCSKVMEKVVEELLSEDRL